MFNLKEFNGTLIPEPYSLNSSKELQRQLLKEIVFYGSGFGWNTLFNEAEEQHFLFPYIDREPTESLEDYIATLRIKLGARIRLQRRVLKTFNPIEGFSWCIEATDNKDFFALILRKM